MQYNYSYEIAAVVIMLFLGFVQLLNNDLGLAKNRSYLTFLLACTLETLTNIASSWGLAHPEIVSSGLNDVICFLFFLSEVAASILSFRYIVNICVASRQRRVLYARLALIPCAVFLILVLTNPMFHLIYKVENNVYSQGAAAWFGYAYIAMFIVASLLVAAMAKSTIRGRNRYAVVIGSLASLSGVIAQYQIKTVLLTGFSNAIVLCLFYIVVQNINEFKDYASNVSNDRAFFLHFENALNLDLKMDILLVDVYQNTKLSVKYGYRTSKALLGEIGEFLENLCGRNSVFSISSNVFAVTLPSYKDTETVKDAIFARFEEPWVIENTDNIISVKIAKICCPEDAGSIKEFYAMVDFIKSILRRESIHNYMEMTPEIRKNYMRRFQVEAALNRALEKKSIQPYFQPIYDSKKQAFTSLEALARMTDEEIGFVPPDEFIEVAENNGLVIPLDLLILEKCCQFIAEEILPRKDQLAIETVQINISVLECMQPNMDEVVLAIIDKYKVPHDMIMLEVTERAAVSAAELMEKHMRSLKEQGIQFALDDYGTGNSNCSYLIEYPFDKVKFDKNMVWASFNNEKAKIILNGEIHTIQQLEIPIVAEGIETEEQLSEMDRLGVKCIQGYYYSKPLPSEEVIAFLTK